MLTVDQYEYIRIAHRVYGKRIKQIARETGHSKNTIKKILRGQYVGYVPRQHQPYPVLAPYMATIDKWLNDDKEQPRKQRHTAVRVYNRLCREFEFEGAETTVRRYVREAKLRLGLKGQQAFIALQPDAGQEAEVDWGTCTAILGGEQCQLKFFCMRSKFSGKHFTCCYPCERQQALFDGHIRAFSFFGGIFPVLIYDNLTTAAQRVFRGKDRKLQAEFDKFRSYYNFTPRFCNKGQAHEKGGVEGMVGFVRRNYMVPVPEAEDLEALNAALLEECLAYGRHRTAGRQRCVNELFEAERQHLIGLPPVPFSNLQVASGGVDKFATVIIDKNRYSVPARYAYLKVSSTMHVERIEIFYGNKLIAEHRRVFGNNKWNLLPEHYLELIAQRPQAFDSARVIRQWRPSWPACLEALLERFCHKQGHTKGIKDFVSVLMLYQKNTAAEVESAVEQALCCNVSSSEAVEHILLNAGRQQDGEFESLAKWPVLPPADVSVYARIGGAL